jgi:hypothetical protein
MAVVEADLITAFADYTTANGRNPKVLAVQSVDDLEPARTIVRAGKMGYLKVVVDAGVSGSAMQASARPSPFSETTALAKTADRRFFSFNSGVAPYGG